MDRFERRKVDRFERRKVDRFERQTVLLEDVVPTYQEGLQGYFKKMLQYIRNLLHASDITKILERIRNILQVPWRSCYTVSGTSCMLLEEVVPTYQECPSSYVKKMYNVSGTPYK